MIGWIVAILTFGCWVVSAYKTGKAIDELKNQIISLSYYAGLSKEQIQGLKKKYNLK